MANRTCAIAQPHQNKINVHRQVIGSRPFIAEGYPENSSNDPFSKSVITQQLNTRLALQNYPDQKYASLCGPAVFFYCLLLNSPMHYKNFIWEMWSKGDAQIANLRIKPSDGCRHPKKFYKSDCSEKISGLDWISLASLRDSENIIASYDSPDDERDGISLPSEVENWFKKAGFTLVDWFERDTIENYMALNNYFGLPNHYIVSLINTKLVDNRASGIGVLPEHWIVWSSTLNISHKSPINKNIKPNDIVKLSVFTWGKRYTPIVSTITYSQFQLYHKRAYVFKG